MSGTVRLVHDVASLGAVAAHLPFAQRFVATQFSLLPEGLRAEERKALRTAVALEIENAWREIVASSPAPAGQARPGARAD
jgi:protein-disulfide isomerase-like protein with CxxC motif